MGTAVIAHGDAAPVLDATEHDVDFVSLFVEGIAVARCYRLNSCESLSTEVYTSVSMFSKIEFTQKSVI